MWLVKQEVVQMKYYITIILFQELCRAYKQSTQNINFKIQTDFGAPLVWRTGKSVTSAP